MPSLSVDSPEDGTEVAVENEWLSPGLAMNAFRWTKAENDLCAVSVLKPDDSYFDKGKE